MPATPAELFSTNDTEPRWSARMADTSDGPSRSPTSPSTNSCPTRCATDMPDRTRSAQEAVGLGDGEGAGETVGLGDRGGLTGAGVMDCGAPGVPFGPHPEHAKANASATPTTRAPILMRVPWPFHSHRSHPLRAHLFSGSITQRIQRAAAAVKHGSAYACLRGILRPLRRSRPVHAPRHR